MTIANRNIRVSLRSLWAAVTIALLPRIGEMTDRGAQAQDKPQNRAAVRDAEPQAEPGEAAANPAQVQRRLQIKQQAAHWEQQFTKMLYGDLELLRVVCGDLPRESRRAIATSGEQAAREAALQMAELQMGGQRRRAEPKPDVEKSPDNPVTILSAALTKSVAEHVGSEQAKDFAEQLARRDDRRKAAMIHEIVAVLDSELVLTASQREEIERSLRQQWNDSMMMALQGVSHRNGVRVFPGLPGACVSPHLTKAQRQRFVPQPDANRQQRGAWQHQAWMQTVNMLNNVNPVGRDQWWFE